MKTAQQNIQHLIDELRQCEPEKAEALRHQMSRLNSLATFSWLDHSPVCTKVVDADFNLVYMSAAGFNVLKMADPATYLGKPYPFDFYPDDFRTQVTSDLLKVINEGRKISQEGLTADREGHEVWFQSTLIPLFENDIVQQVLVVSIDITRQKRAERELQKSIRNLEEKYHNSLAELRTSEERYALALKGANDGLWDWDVETDRVYYSPRWKSMLGYEDHELGDTLDVWAQLVHPDDKQRALDMARECLAGRADNFEVEMRMLHKQGGIVNVLSRAFTATQGPDGKPNRLVGTHVDITERKKAEDFRRKTADILEMIAIGKPTSSIYDAIALMYEARHPGMRCSMLELDNGVLLHGGAPSLPKAYCDAVHGLKNGPNVGSCGTSTYTGKRCLVEDIATDPKWADIKEAALVHGLRCCWSEPIRNSRGEVLGAFGMYYNHPALPNEEESDDLKSAARLAGIIMERDHQQKRIHELAFTDQLTRLASRDHFYQYLDDLIHSATKHKRQFSLLYVDLDGFKDVNDSLGHDCGDALLQTMAERLENASSRVDFIARLSGDEFCIVLEDIADPFLCSQVAQECLVAVAAPTTLSGRTLAIGCSIGISHFPNDGDSTSILLKAADTALYSAKVAGRGRYAFYEPQLTEQAEYRFQFEQYLREAIDKQQLSLAFQPQVETRTGRIIGAEALCRWHHPALGDVPPSEFIPAAERIGMIKPLTEWVLLNACQQALLWRNTGAADLRISVNISPSFFLDKELIERVRHVIDETGIEPGQLVLEVTENVVQTNPENLSVFSELKKLGVLLSIDDFGTGYSSFASLKHIEVDSLKIDKYFVDDILRDNKTRMLIASMMDIGHNLGHTIVAEGVEQNEQLLMLEKLGCEIIQGYLFYKPMSSQALLDLLHAKARD